MIERERERERERDSGTTCYTLYIISLSGRPTAAERRARRNPLADVTAHRGDKRRTQETPRENFDISR